MSQEAAPLAAHDVHRTYHLAGHDLPVLRGVNLQVQAGEKVFLCGQSGAGKTTLLYVLGGLERPDAGKITVNGKDLYLPEPKRGWMQNFWVHCGVAVGALGVLPNRIAAMSGGDGMPAQGHLAQALPAIGVPLGLAGVGAYHIGRGMFNKVALQRASIRNNQMGFVFQHYFLLPELTALENVMLPAMIGGKKGETRARELLDKVGLTARLQHLPTELSGGEQQRVAIARALINNPGIIYADEPTGNLDASTGSGVIDMLMQVVDEAKKTLIVVTHDQTLAKRGDRRLLLKEGRLEEG